MTGLRDEIVEKLHRSYCSDPHCKGVSQAEREADAILPIVERHTAALTAERDQARAEVAWWEERFPCDGLCSDAPEEDCSRHGRKPADLWRLAAELGEESDD